MKALVIQSARKIVIEDRVPPVLSSDTDVIVHVRDAGICGSDMTTYLGSPRRMYPVVPGHEFVGEVVQIGEKVSRVAVGDRVVVEPITYCGKCYACRSGRPNICRTVNNAGVHRDGGMQEYFCAMESRVYKLPDRLSYRQAALIEPFTIGLQVNMRAQIRRGDTVLIHGAGPIGLIVMRVAIHNGANCIVSEISQTRLDLAKRFGAREVINPLRENVAERARALTDGRGPDVVVDAAGLRTAVTEAIDYVAENGRIVNMCFADAPMQVDLQKMIEKNIRIVGSRLETHQFQKVIDEYVEDIVAMESLITDVFPLERGNEGFELFAQRKEGTGKILIEISEEE